MSKVHIPKKRRPSWYGKGVTSRYFKPGRLLSPRRNVLFQTSFEGYQNVANRAIQFEPGSLILICSAAECEIRYTTYSGEEDSALVTYCYVLGNVSSLVAISSSSDIIRDPPKYFKIIN